MTAGGTVVDTKGTKTEWRRVSLASFVVSLALMAVAPFLFFYGMVAGFGGAGRARAMTLITLAVACAVASALADVVTVIAGLATRRTDWPGWVPFAVVLFLGKVALGLLALSRL